MVIETTESQEMQSISWSIKGHPIQFILEAEHNIEKNTRKPTILSVVQDATSTDYIR